MLWIENPVLSFLRIAIGEVFRDPGGIDRAVNDRVGHVHALGSELARHTLGDCAQAMLG